MTSPPAQPHPSPQDRLAELERRVTEAEAAARSDREAVEMRDALIAAISRELNNQLAPVTLAVERLRSLLAGGEAARIAAGLDLVERACGTFARRSRSMLEFSERAGRTAPLVLQPVDLSGLVDAAAHAHADIARRAGCVLQVASRPGLLALASPAGVDQVLDQLLANALKFGAGRPVMLSVRRGADARAVLSVRDAGPGVPADLAGGLFGFRNPRPPGTPGLGIGLWVAAQWAEAMGGSLRLAPAEGPGACFELALAQLPG